MCWQGLPSWLSGKESTCQCRRHGFDPWSGKTAHAVKQPSLCAATTKPAQLGPRAATTEALMPSSPQAAPTEGHALWSMWSAIGEAMTMKSSRTAPKSSPGSLPEKAWAKQWRPSAVKNQLILKRDIKKLSGMKHIDIWISLTVHSQCTVIKQISEIS